MLSVFTIQHFMWNFNWIRDRHFQLRPPKVTRFEVLHSLSATSKSASMLHFNAMKPKMYFKFKSSQVSWRTTQISETKILVSLPTVHSSIHAHIPTHQFNLHHIQGSTTHHQRSTMLISQRLNSLEYNSGQYFIKHYTSTNTILAPSPALRKLCQPYHKATYSYPISQSCSSSTESSNLS